MKTFLPFILFSFSLFLLLSGQSYAFDCQLVSQIHSSKRFDCQIQSSRGTKTFYVLSLQGSYPQVSYDHAFLMATQARDAALSETLERFHQKLSSGNLAQQQITHAIVDCYQQKMWNSLSLDFQNSVHSFYRGLQAGLRQKGQSMSYTEKDLERAALGVELSIAGEGLERRAAEDPLGTYAELALSCGIHAPISLLDNIFQELGDLAGNLKIGCLGFVAPASYTRGGALIHGRNLDANLVRSWDKAPTLFIIHEPGYYRYAAAASAGLLYPGGVSGFNEMGIAVSLHEMSTTKYKVHHAQHSSDITPYLTQRILREAKNIDEAIQIVRSSGHFGAWTILVSDSKTNEAASIELSGYKMQVSRRYQNQPMGQSNHFFGSKMQDQAFSYSANKFFESHSRFAVISKALNSSKGQIDITWGINHLAGHIDAYEGFRSFGRTATKAYTVMSTLAVPLRHEFWITSGDRKPASHSPFLGFEINFDQMSFQPLVQQRVQLYKNISDWEHSLETYSKARLNFIENHPQESAQLLTQAINQAARDGFQELPYYFMRARVNIYLKNFEQAYNDLDFLWRNRQKLHPYGQGLVALYSGICINQMSRDMNRNVRSYYELIRDQRLKLANSLLRSLLSQTTNFDLKAKISWIPKIRQGGIPKLPVLDFVTVE